MHFDLQSCLLKLLYCHGGGPADLPSPWGGDMKTESAALGAQLHLGTLLVLSWCPLSPFGGINFGKASAAACFTPRSRRGTALPLEKVDTNTRLG